MSEIQTQQNPENQPFKVVIVDRSVDSIKKAEDEAKERYNEELEKGSKFQRFLNGIWKGNVAKDYYMIKYTREALAEIVESQDLFYKNSADQRARSKQSTIEKYQGDYEELIHTDAGESREVNDTDSELSVAVKSLVSKYCKGELNDQTLDEERSRLIEAFQEKHGTVDIKKNAVTVDNLLEIAKEVSAAIEHGMSLDYAIESMQVISGEDRSGVRGEAKYNKVDKVIAGLSSTKVGSLIGPEIVASAVTIAMCVAKIGTRVGVSAAAKAAIIPGASAATAGIWAGFRENKRTQDERTEHMRGMAQGNEFDDNDERRVEMETTRYNTVTSIDLEKKIIEAKDNIDINNVDSIKAAIDILAEINTRIHISDTENIALISYSDDASITEERMALDIARSEMKALLGQNLTEDVRQAIDVDQDSGLELILQKRSEVFIDLINDDIAEKDKAFNQLKKRRVIKAAVTGAGVGLGIGLLAQELFALGDPSQAGLGGILSDSQSDTNGQIENQTLLRGFLDNVKNPDITETEIVDKTVDVHEYISNHSDETVSIKRDSWFDNDTSGVYDKNELGLWWGGDKGISGDGYQMSVSHMTAEGSYHGDSSADWSKLAENGELKLAVSATGDTQNQVFMVDIGPDGQINIPEDSPAAKFFSNENGQAEFNGAYAEVVQIDNVDEEGLTHVRPLATLVGDNSVENITDQITIEKIIAAPEVAVEMPPVIPIESRRSLESLKSRSEKAAYYRGDEYLSRKEISKRRTETSPRLVENPGADLIPAQEYKWYKKLVQNKMGEKYVNDIENIVSKSPELNELPLGLKSIVVIPVNAAGKAESAHIYDVLTKGYGRQDFDAIKKNAIVLHVNWFDSYPESEAEDSAANIQKTKSEIERVKNDFPDLNVSVIETEFKRSEVKDGVFGHVARKMNDVILFALENANSKGRLNDSDDVVIIRNDADIVGISVDYLKNFQSDFEKNPEVDIFKGTTTFDNTKAGRLPGLVLVSNFMQTMDLLNGARNGAVHTGGANYGIRASTLAATGSIGFDTDDNGAGSDDVNIGLRIKSARDGAISSVVASRSQKKESYYRNSDETSVNKSSKRRISKRLAGARIDIDSDRSERMYENNIPTADQWNKEHGIDDNGYGSRDGGLVGKMTESIIDDYNEVIERIRFDMERSINIMAKRDKKTGEILNRNVIYTALASTFPSNKQKGGDGFILKNNGPSEGVELTITPSGAGYLQSYLTRNENGHDESYGSRKLRLLYGEDTGAGKSRLSLYRIR